ncbi:hypothetical protein FVEG_12283 [Fusarium verticillioides 7600]|uniref:Uncharacterized protein n=1 Tax=Gibberella moniliformis (strain M3125 / FGSC 7600) TaxID=334819 RepID=W7N1C1_GIBM7|nr:hypothetical protein FVEG_12283 [Fusarium verticillioides 7600]EWG53960.1 hypothetical protein FVEG_12283 [Fusarium verticillioides 7600]
MPLSPCITPDLIEAAHGAMLQPVYGWSNRTHHASSCQPVISIGFNKDVFVPIDRRHCTGQFTQKPYVAGGSPEARRALPPKINKSFQIQTAHHDTPQQKRLKRDGYRCRASPSNRALELPARSESQYRK